MDPNRNLEEQRELIAEIMALEDSGDTSKLNEIASAGAKLAELAQALDEWIRNGGFLPKEWQQKSSGR